MSEKIVLNQKRPGTLDWSRSEIYIEELAAFIKSLSVDQKTYSEVVHSDSPQKIHFRIVIPTGTLFSVDEFLTEMKSFRKKFIPENVLVFKYETIHGTSTVYDFIVLSHYVQNSVEMATVAKKFNESYTKKHSPGISVNFYRNDKSLLLVGNSEPGITNGVKTLISASTLSEDELLARSTVSCISGAQKLEFKVKQIVHLAPQENVPPPSEPVISLPPPEAIHKNDNAPVEETPIVETPAEIPECDCSDANDQAVQGDSIPAACSKKGKKSKKDKKGKKSKKSKKSKNKRGFLMTLLLGPKKSKKSKKSKESKKEEKSKKNSKSGFVFDFRLGREKKTAC